MQPEVTVHQTTPSQIVNLKHFVLAFLLASILVTIAFVTGTTLVLAGLVVPVFYAWWKWMVINATKLTLTDQRLIVSTGIINKKTNETELYRVRDTSIEEPFWYRMFGVGNVLVYTTDEAEGQLHFNAYNKPHWIKDQVRNNAEVCRQKKRWGSDNVLIHDVNQ